MNLEKISVRLSVEIIQRLSHLSNVTLLNALLGMYGIVWSQASADLLTVALSVFIYCRYKPRI